MRMPNLELDALLSTAEVAALRGVAPSTVNRWAKSGRLRVAVKVPGQTGANLYLRADVLALFAETTAA